MLTVLIVVFVCVLDAVIRGSSLSAVDSDESNEYWLTDSSFLKVCASSCRVVVSYCVVLLHCGCSCTSQLFDLLSNLDSSSFYSQPTSLSVGDASLGADGIQSAERLKSLPAMFDATELVERQYSATSRDGTQVCHLYIFLVVCAVCRHLPCFHHPFLPFCLIFNKFVTFS